jgi:hypothetical protein
MSVETDIAIMLAFILSPSRCRLVRDEHLWCGDHAISRGVLGLSFQGPRGAGAPLRRVAVSSSGSLCCPEFFFGTFRFSFLSVFRLKRESPFCSFGDPGSFLPGPSELERDAFAGLPSTAPWEAPSREGLYGRSPSTRQVLSITFDRFFNLIHKLWITLADAWAGREPLGGSVTAGFLQ